MTKFEPISTTDLETINGGNKGRAIVQGAKKAGSWLWRNVVGPIGGGAIYDWATGGGQQQAPQQPPAQPQPPKQ